MSAAKAPQAGRKGFAALSTVAGLSGWWTRDKQGESAVGGVHSGPIFLCHPDGEKPQAPSPWRGVIGLIPNRQVCWRCQARPPEWIGGPEKSPSILRWRTARTTIVLFNHDRSAEQSPIRGPLLDQKSGRSSFLLSPEREWMAPKSHYLNGNGSRPAPLTMVAGAN